MTSFTREFFFLDPRSRNALPVLTRYHIEILKASESTTAVCKNGFRNILKFGDIYVTASSLSRCK